MASVRPPLSDFSTPVRYDGDDVIVEVRGELDIATAPLLQEQLDQLIAAGARRMLVDMAETSFVDTTGLGALLCSLRRMQSHRGQLGLVNLRPAAQRLLELTALDDVFARARARIQVSRSGTGKAAS